MGTRLVSADDALARLASFDTIIDARSPGEFAIDRIPGAVNWPSLDDAERALVGTEYKQVSAFDARKRGAALVARNIARHIEREVFDKPRDWKPLVYCWRGGQRSGALSTVLGQIGFQVAMLDGGYREYRRAVLAELDQRMPNFDFRVVCGTTGSGKSRLLGELARQGRQVLDLEALAEHRGSVLGLVPGHPQPSQKAFDSRLWFALRGLDPARPVFVESESKKIGDVRVPETLIARMRDAPCVLLNLDVDARVALLLEDYAFFVADTGAFCERLNALRPLRGNATIDAWQDAARVGQHAEVVRALLVEHYDPIYLQSMRRNFRGVAEPWLRIDWRGDAASLAATAARIGEAAERPGPAVAATPTASAALSS
ncbi:tRNA 2-selenouridine(34) synthase MnmH [Piscinibacter koreensis]|uniref:tRNA 2-selenouridine(34) synthase MnmH n=1 Tax=Piscinibacter koreensis TaxID=2742824 RepID=A0A7Y6NL17_9BURK|nr:tRNA 2-selenouridine(34) synthase MnmH [Schlegelella koreensis]NUZ05047.1 tRNA 2-selenouridine(34) synthase MnmH [Schlegelella koreensis]